MHAVTDRHPTERASGESRTPVQLDADVYHAVRQLAREDERPIARYVNRVLREHIARERGRPTE